MKNIRVICNYSVSIHSNRFLKHVDDIDLFHLDVKNYGINQSDNILDHLSLDLKHLVLTDNPLTGLKLLSKYGSEKVSLCIMYDDCNYQVLTDSYIVLISHICGFDVSKLNG